MTYEVTATRKRPQTFEELIGQEFVVSTLKNAIAQGKIAHAYLFAGPRGVGKTSAARILAKSLNCEKGPTPKPCGVCSSCREITNGSSLDVIEIDGASNTSVNDIREIKDEVLFPPNSSRYKIYIIDEVHMLSNSAFNALLKTIEEPPPYIVFIFATTEIHKVPATIRSRCQQYYFRHIGIEDIITKLKSLVAEGNLEAEEEALFWIAKEANGSLRDAYMIFDQVVSFSEEKLTIKNIRDKLGTVGTDEINSLLALAIQKDGKQLFEYLDSLLARGVSVEQFSIDLAEYFRSLLLIKAGIKKEAILKSFYKNFPERIVNHFNLYQIEIILDNILSLYRNLRLSVDQRLELELLFSKILHIEELITPKEIVEGMKALRDSLLPRGDSSKKTPPRGTQTTSKISKTLTTGSPDTTVESMTGRQPIGKSQREEEASQTSAILTKLVTLLRKNKPALASAVQQAYSHNISRKQLTLYYNPKDKFSGEMINRDRSLICQKLKEITNSDFTLKVEFANDMENKESQIDDKRIEMIKRIFRGEIVKGV